jgi:hypothetical protein
MTDSVGHLGCPARHRSRSCPGTVNVCSAFVLDGTHRTKLIIHLCMNVYIQYTVYIYILYIIILLYIYMLIIIDYIYIHIYELIIYIYIYIYIDDSIYN